jgi:hypothetical protein
MGWISKRHMQQGGSIGGRRKGRIYPKDGAPLRRIVGMVMPSTNLFVPSRVLLDCGHEADSWGGVRARCPACRKPPQGV